MRSTRRRQQRGGNNFSLRQGQDFSSYHTQQHGGAHGALQGAPLDYTGALPAGLRDSAGLAGYDAHFQEASGMSDLPSASPAMQKGGSRKNTSRKSKKSKASKKSKKSKKSKSSKKSKKSKSSKKSKKSKSSKKSKKSKSSKKSKKSKSSKSSKKSQRGGRMLGHSPSDAPTMLLTPSEAARAGTGDFSNPLLKH